MGRKKEEKSPRCHTHRELFLCTRQQRCCLVGGTIENLGEDGSGCHFHDANHWLDIISHHVLLLFFVKKLLNTDCHQADYQTHERDKHYAENEADIETPSPDEIIQTEMIHRVIIKIGPVFPHHDIYHDANINEEKQSYYQDSLFFFGK